MIPVQESHGRASIRGPRILLLAGILLLPGILRAQANADLPDAPAPATAAAPEAGAAFTARDAGTSQFLGRPDTAGLVALASAHGFSDAAPDGAELAAWPVEDMDATSPEPWGGVQSASGLHFNLNGMFSSMNRPALTGVTAAGQEPERYHLKMMLWQSLAFTGVEDTYRLVTDSYFRHLLADQPFWQDYKASMGQWNMGRWWDGDDFLVDDIGHPMEGGVSSFIEIQNSPRQRDLRIGFTHEYWRSRFLGMMWATVFSTQQKIGPLGEAALGNDGGYTYPLNCPVPCKSYKPGDKYTNNTGWTDFIITPTVGTVWVLLEDFLDLEVSDRIQGDNMNAVFPKIVRGALNPCRTMANFMRWRKPWYRDFQHETSALHLTRGAPNLPRAFETEPREPRFQVFPHLNAISLHVNTASCTYCRQELYGYGVGFSSRMSKWTDFDSDVDYQSNASPLPSDRAGGNFTMGTFGFRSGFESSHAMFKASIRPGFLSYDHAYETSPVKGGPTPDIGRITHFITALALTGDVTVSRHFALRGVVANTAVRYRSAELTVYKDKPPYLNWLSTLNFINTGNWTYQAGPVLRF